MFFFAAWSLYAIAEIFMGSKETDTTDGSTFTIFKLNMAILLMLYSSSICGLICGIPGYCYNIYDRSSNDKYDLNMHIAKVESLPTIKYDKDLHKAIHFCVVCMSEFKNNEVLTYLPCDPRHFFHTKCIKSWLINQQTCPICKEEVHYTRALEQH